MQQAAEIERPHRGTLFVEEAEIISHSHLEGDQHILRLQAPKCAAKALPGSFVHLQCDPMLAMRRPLSLMLVDSEAGWVDILYKALGEGTRLLTQRQPGETISMIGPIGTPFKPTPERTRPLLIGGGVGMPPMVFLADSMRQSGAKTSPLVILGSEVPFPFNASQSKLEVAGIDADTNAAMPLLEEWGVASRLASLQGYNGTHQGYVTDLARRWLDSLSSDERTQVEIFSCGPHPMLEAVAAVARDYGLPCQVSLEEFMACAVGGCAGCAVEVTTESGTAMKRVCVDGPVFDANQVFPAVG
ncbi:dihydroorotate dehydrogenase electron transfer subunit [Solemya pervernicosa gill symbiont]|uniref:Dihydroorotate dehydrogenase electron transfer subunit n=2 Tax=Gammaproteobacteria incertae sedis TaxID=118884 RepID=A0A1T2LA11_9GAMM|nr:dihydroorotate dehydrogenase electron transfer subunit [Candidatus Reidiella endopervernicosa]OOZ41931.1 dihydroorotate dehydrogenase electron transfer subunit [Solemya pervernicosa gill symbiont]QKQ24897.1 dihydroorotate dehydrogenase electron transfer subunit [Candidatus Reidiella endopervernicosa]